MRCQLGLQRGLDSYWLCSVSSTLQPTITQLGNGQELRKLLYTSRGSGIIEHSFLSLLHVVGKWVSHFPFRQQKIDVCCTVT
jgi:hypothetical protein